MGYQLIELAGRIVKHGVGVLLLCWRRVLRAMLITWVAAFLLAEVVAAIVTQSVPPGIAAHVAAIAIATAVAYGIALTVLADELLAGAIETVRLLEGDAKAGARAAAIAAEREVGQLWRGRPRWPDRRSAPVVETAAAVSPASEIEVESSRETADDIAATDEFSSTAPRPRVNARPVPAGQLPRIEWAYERRSSDGPGSVEAPSPAITQDDPLPPLPRKQVAQTLPDLMSERPSAEITPHAFAAGRDGATSSHDATQEPEMAAPEPRMVPVVSHPIVSQPDDASPHREQPNGTQPRGVWSRISQALVGNTLVEPAHWDDIPSENDPAPTDLTSSSPSESDTQA